MGLELEMFGFDSLTLAPLGTHEARLGSEELLERVHQLVPESHPKVDSETGVLIGLDLGCGNFSLEPGGQLEYATCPQTSLAAIAEDLRQGLQLLEEAACGQVLFLDHGTNPVAGEDLPLLIPKQRYQILDRYFTSQPGGRGVHMMRHSATAQPNLDVHGEEDWLDAVNLTFVMTPLARALFANSRYFQRQLCPPGSERQRIWAAIDPTRTGIPTGVPFAEDLIDRYAEWAEQAHVFLAGNLPLEEQPLFGQLTFRQWLEEGYRGTRPTFKDWESHLGTLFPDLRLRRFLEIRMVDAQNYEHALAPLAFWAAVLQSADNRQRMWDFLHRLAQAQGLSKAADLLHHPLEYTPQILLQAVDTALVGCQEELARASLQAFGDWVRVRPSVNYPESAWEFVRAQASLHPSRQLNLLPR